MFILQRVQNAQITYTAHEYRSELYSEVRSNFGLTDVEFLEFVYTTYFERENISLSSFEGEIPEPESQFAKIALKAQAKQRALKTAR
jgi:hypothetical protein